MMTNKTLARALGAAVRAERKARDMSIETLAGQTSIEASFLRRLEGGRVLPSLITFARLCTALEVSADKLLGFER